jgi:hypothetical protein
MNRPPPASRRDARARLAAAAVSLGVAFALLGALLWRADALGRHGLVGPLWYLVLLSAGLAAAACLFALFRSYARYSGKALDGRLELGGPAALMLAIVGLGFVLAPVAAQRFDLTLFLHEESRAVVPGPKARVRLDFAADRREGEIGANGAVRFVGIPAELRGGSARLTFDDTVYELADASPSVRLNADAVYVAVRPKLLRFAGEVVDESDRPVADAQVRVGSRETTTDAHGRFALALPANLDDTERELTISAKGYAVWRDVAVPGANRLIARLEKAR